MFDLSDLQEKNRLFDMLEKKNGVLFSQNALSTK